MSNVLREIMLKSFDLPRYWEEHTELIASPEVAIARLKLIEKDYSSAKGERITAFLADREGNLLHVGMAGESWMLTAIQCVNERDREYQYAIGNHSARGRITFLFPEWTEISRKRLIPLRTAERVICEWIMNGQLSQSSEWTHDIQHKISIIRQTNKKNRHSRRPIPARHTVGLWNYACP